MDDVFTFFSLWILFATFRPGPKALSLEELNPWLLGLLASGGKGFSYPEEPALPVPPTHLNLVPPPLTFYVAERTIL